MSTHTPGPWRVQGADNAIVGQRNGLPECIGQVFNVMEGRQYPGAWSPVSEANARLIAAAPALLKALETLATNYETSYRRRGGTSALPELDKARAAIAQARGERQ